MTLSGWIYPTAAQSGYRTILQRDVNAYYLNAGTANGTLVQLWGCTGAGNQTWAVSNGALVNPVSGRCLDGTNSSTNGTQPAPPVTSLPAVTPYPYPDGW